MSTESPVARLRHRLCWRKSCVRHHGSRFPVDSTPSRCAFQMKLIRLILHWIVFSLDDNDNAGRLRYSSRESFRQGGTTTTCPGAGFHDMGSLPIPSHWRSMVPRAMIPDGSRLLLNASTYWSAGQFKFVGKTPFMVPRPRTFRFV
jgi:hypothetical protein